MICKPGQFNKFNIYLDKKNFISFNYNNIDYNLYFDKLECGQKRSDIVELNQTELLDDLFLEKLEFELNKNRVKKIYFRLFPITSSEHLRKIKEKMIKKKYHFSLYETNIIYLDENEKTLKKNLRSSFKSLVNKEKNIYYSDPNCEKNKEKIFEDWIKLYSKAIMRGNKIISSEAKTILLDSFNKSEIIIFLAYNHADIYDFNNIPLGGMLFSKKKNYVYYSLSANSNEIENDKKRAIGHAIMWHAIKFFKNNKIKYLDLGTIFPDQAEKINNINKFKLGFGGKLVDTLFFEKFFYEEI